MPKIRLHDLRHTCASLMLAAGVPAKMASERLGHSSIAITLDRYSHIMPAMEQDAADKLGAMVWAMRDLAGEIRTPPPALVAENGAEDEE